MDSVIKIGDRIRALREEKGMTQQALADALHVKRETINMWENGFRDMKTGSIILLADFFNVSSDYLLGRVTFKSADIDIQSICKKTGLSNDAVNALVEMNMHDVICGDGIEGEDPFIEDWAQKKDGVFEIINYLLSWPLLEEVIFLSEEIHDRVQGQKMPLPIANTPAREDFEKLCSAAEEMGLRECILHPLEYDHYKQHEVNKRVRTIGDWLYRLIKYGTVWAPDGNLYNDQAAFERAIAEDAKHGKT